MKYAQQLHLKGSIGTSMGYDNPFVCPLCANPLVKRHGKFGTFYGCAGYPECRYGENKKAYKARVASYHQQSGLAVK